MIVLCVASLIEILPVLNGMIAWGILKFPIFHLSDYCHGLRSTILMMLADSLLTKTTISIALAFKGSQAFAFGYLAKVFSTSVFGLYCSNSLSGNARCWIWVLAWVSST